MSNRAGPFLIAVFLTATLPLQLSVSAQDDRTAYDNYYIDGARGSHNVVGVEDHTINFDEKDFAYKVYGGRRISKHFGLEMAVVDYTHPEGSMFQVGGVSEKYEIDEWGTSLHAVGYIPHGIGDSDRTETFEVFGKLGPAWVNQNVDARAAVQESSIRVTENRSGFGGSFGLGTSIHLSSQFTLRAEGETILWVNEGIDNNRLLGFIGIEYHFR